MDKGLEGHVKELVSEKIEAEFGADTELVEATKEKAGLKDESSKTKTRVTVVYEFDSFVGVRQAQLGADAGLSNVRNALTGGGGRVVSVETDFSDGSKHYKDVSHGYELNRQMGQKGEELKFLGPEPTVDRPAITVAPLGVENERGGLESGNLVEEGGAKPKVVKAPADSGPAPAKAPARKAPAKAAPKKATGK